MFLLIYNINIFKYYVITIINNLNIIIMIINILFIFVNYLKIIPFNNK